MPPTNRRTLRKVVLDVPRKELARLEGVPGLDAVESFRVLHQFRFDRTRFAGVCQIKFRTSRLSPADLRGRAGITRVETLSRRDGGFLAYVEGRPTAAWARIVASTGGRLHPPFELTPEAWRISVVGTSRQLDQFLAKLRRLRLRYRARSIGSAEFREQSPLASLTPRQRETLSAAYRLGYYSMPRRADSARVAQSLRAAKSTTVEHLRKAENRLLDTIMGL